MTYKPAWRVPVRWAGSKRWLAAGLAPAICEALAASPRAELVSPFVGAGHVEMMVRQLGSANTLLLGDVNPHLMALWKVLGEKQIDRVVSILRRLPQDPASFREVRSLGTWPADYPALTAVRQAARFVFLNQLSFNGLWRVNAAGENNVPMGRTADRAVRTINVDALEKQLYVWQTLCSRIVTVASEFPPVLLSASPGDVVFLDPPYEGTTFNAYARPPWTQASNVLLGHLVAKAVERGVHVLLCNADLPVVRSRYKGLKFARLWGPRSISADALRRHSAPELLFGSEIFHSALAKLEAQSAAAKG